MTYISKNKDTYTYVRMDAYSKYMYKCMYIYIYMQIMVNYVTICFTNTWIWLKHGGVLIAALQ